MTASRATTFVKSKPDRQIPATGVPAGIEQLFLGALLWAEPAESAAVLDLVADDDLADPHLAVVLATVRQMVGCAAHISPQLVMDRITRRGVQQPVLQGLLDCVTSGAAVGALRDYAAGVLAASLRRKTEQGGHALTEAANALAEGDIPVAARRIATRITATATRLTSLRGES